MKIKLTLYKSVIVEAIKAETYLKAQIDKSAKEGSQEFTYNETAGDEVLHERKIERAISVAESTLVAEIANFLGSTASTIGNNVYIKADSADTDKLYLYITVSDRFNQSMTDPLAKFCSKFIEDSAIASWYGTLGITTQAQYYGGIVMADIIEIKNALQKTTPVAVTVPYTTSLDVTGSCIYINVGDTETITYTIDEDTIDDIEAIPSNGCLKVCRGEDGFEVKAVHEGICTLAFYSKHDESVSASIEVTVFKD